MVVHCNRTPRLRRSPIVSSVLQGGLIAGLLTLSPGSPVGVGGWAIAPAQAQAAIPPLVRRGYSLLGQGLVNDAIKVFQEAVQKFPNVVEAKLGLAIAYRRAGQDDNAWVTYQKVLAQEPDNLLALKTVGILGGFRGEWQAQGIEALNRYLTLRSQDEEARAQRALLLGYQGRFPEALRDYEQVLRGKPTPEVLLGAAQVYTYSGDFARGLELFNRYRATGGKIEKNAAIAYARALRGTGNAAQAIQVLQELPATRSTQLDETAIQARSELAQAYLDNRQPAEALAVLDPLKGRRDARLARARALNEIANNQNLQELYPEVASLYKTELSETPNPRPQLVREVADVLSGIPAERPFALQLYRQLIQQQPDDRILAIQLLALESQLGQINPIELRRRILGAVQPLPAEPAQQLAIARALIPLEPFPELFPIYQQLLQAGVNEPFLNFRIAQLLIERNDFAGAQEALSAYQLSPQGSQDLAPQLLFAEIERRQGNLEASAQRYQAVLMSPIPDNDVKSAALRALAGIRLSQGRNAEALAIYDQLLAVNPQDLQLLMARTAIAYQIGLISVPQAESVLSRWLLERPGQFAPELYGLVAALPTDPRKEALYQALIANNPNDVTIQVRLIEILAQRNPFEAQAQVNRLLARIRATAPESPGLYLLQAQLLQALGNLDQAGRSYQMVLQRDPLNLAALSGLGGIRFQQRRFESATQLYSQVLAYNPDDRGAQVALAELLAAQGRKLDALQQFEVLQRGGDQGLNRRMRQVQEDFLRQRGFQPSWERF